MAYLFIRSERIRRGGSALEFGWITTAAARSEVPTNRPLSIPIDASRSLPTRPPRRNDPQAEDPPQTATPARTVPIRPVDVKDLLSTRDPQKRGIMLEKYGGSDATERAVRAGLMWLRRQQRSDGRWRLDAGYPDACEAPNLATDTGATALALLAFLGSGQTHRSGDHIETVAKGLAWLKRIQRPDGDFHDRDEYGRQPAYYAHSMATIAVCEAYAMTGDESLRDPAERAIAFLIDSQQPIQGGWKYVPQDETTMADLSVTGWALMALQTARAAGFVIDEETFRLASGFLDAVQEHRGARYKYEPTDPPDRVSVAMTAEGLLCRQYLGWPPDHPAMADGLRFLTLPQHGPRWTAGRRNVYEWYYVGQVLHNIGGQPWREWYDAAQQAIVPHQVRAGSSRGPLDVRGSWHPTDPPGAPLEYADKAGRLYLTAMSILILELPYRHLPLYEN